MDGDVSQLIFWLEELYEDKKECLYFGDVYIYMCEVIMHHIYGLLSFFFSEKISTTTVTITTSNRDGGGKERQRERE